MRTELLRRVVFLSTFGIATFSGGVLMGQSRHRRLPEAAPSPTVAFAPFGDGGTGVPAFVVFPASSTGAPICDGPSCPFPGPEPGEEQHQCVTFYPDQGGTVTMDKSTLGASSCNPACTTLVEEFTQYAVVIEGERLDRLDREVRRGHIGRVEACTMEPTSDADSGFAVSHVKILQPTSFHFDKAGNFVAEEN
jgi:hypothetical protein